MPAARAFAGQASRRAPAIRAPAATTSWASSSSRPAGGKRYDGPWTWTAAITSPELSAIGAATDAMPGSNSSIAQA